MAISKFTKFNTKQDFTLFNKDDFSTDEYWNCEDLYNFDAANFDGVPQSHLLVGFWKFDFPEESRIPGAATYKYNIGVKCLDGDGNFTYRYVSCPAHLNKIFDSIKADKSLIDEINKGNCQVIPYTYEKRGKQCYAVEFC